MPSDRVQDAVWEALAALGGRRNPNPDAALRRLESLGLKTAEVREAAEELHRTLRDRMRPAGHAAEGTLRINPAKLSPQARRTMGLVSGQLEFFAKNTAGISPELKELLEAGAARTKAGDLSATAVKAPVMAAKGIKEALVKGKGTEAVERWGMMQSLLSRAGRQMEDESLGALRREIPWVGTTKRDVRGQQFFKTKGTLAGVPIGKLDGLAERMREFMLDQPLTREKMMAEMEREARRGDTEKALEGTPDAAGRWEERRKGPYGTQGDAGLDEESVPKRTARGTRKRSEEKLVDLGLKKDRRQAAMLNNPKKWESAGKGELTPEWEQNELVGKFLDEKHPGMGPLQRAELLGEREANRTDVSDTIEAIKRNAIKRGKQTVRTGLQFTGLEGAVNRLNPSVVARLAAIFRQRGPEAKAVVEGVRTAKGTADMMVLPKLLRLLRKA